MRRLAPYLSLLLSACGAGSTAIASGVGSNDVNSPPSLAGLEIRSPRTSPALVRFVLADPEGDPADVQLTFRHAGASGRATLIGGAFTDPESEERAMAETDPRSLATSGAGVLHSFLWDFATDLGPGQLFREVELTAHIVVASGASRAPLQAEPVREDLGNEPPILQPPVIGVDVDPVVSGIARLPLRVFDSLEDDVFVRIEYEILDPSACTGFVVARDAELFDADEPTPEFQGDTQAVAIGAEIEEPEGFFWETDLADPGVPAACDLANVARQVRVKFTVVEVFEDPDDEPFEIVVIALEGLRVDNRMPVPALLPAGVGGEGEPRVGPVASVVRGDARVWWVDLDGDGVRELLSSSGLGPLRWHRALGVGAWEAWGRALADLEAPVVLRPLGVGAVGGRFWVVKNAWGGRRVVSVSGD